MIYFTSFKTYRENSVFQQHNYTIYNMTQQRVSSTNKNNTDNTRERQANKENIISNNNNTKKARKVSFRDYPPPAADTTNEHLTTNSSTNVAYSDLRGSSVPEHPSCLSISEVSSAGIYI